jgi:ribosome-associated protein
LAARKRAASRAGSRAGSAARASRAGSAAKAPRTKRKAASPPQPSSAEQARDLALAVAKVALDHKALKVEIIDVRGRVDYADYIVLMGGTSDRHVGALARYIEQELAREHNTPCVGIEGKPQASWVLMDYGDIVVHVFHRDTRGYYDLESLWIDAARVSPS